MIKCIPKIVWIITVYFSVGINSHFCKYHVCLTWTVSDQVLNLSCRVSNLHFRVKIQDPSGKLMGECVPGQKTSSCDEYANNVVIAQNIKTNETTCMIRGIIDNSLNGKWKCLHGTNTGLAEVEVTVLRNKEQHADQNCLAFVLPLMCYFGVITLWLTFLYMYPDNVNILEGLLTKILNRSRCQFDVSTMKRSISVCKGASFFLMTVLLVIIVFVISNPRDNSSQNLAMLCSVALLFGIAVSVLCLNIKEAEVQLARTNPNSEETSCVVVTERPPAPTATTASACGETLNLKRDHESISTEDRKGYSPLPTACVVVTKRPPAPTATTASACGETLNLNTAIPRQANEGPSYSSVLKCPLKRDHESMSTEDRKGYSPLPSAEMETEESTTSIEREETQ